MCDSNFRGNFPLSEMNKILPLTAWLLNILNLNPQVAMYYIKKHKSEHKSHKINKSPEVREKKLKPKLKRFEENQPKFHSCMNPPITHTLSAFKWHFRCENMWIHYHMCTPVVYYTNLQFICNNKNHFSPPKRITRRIFHPSYTSQFRPA